VVDAIKGGAGDEGFKGEFEGEKTGEIDGAVNE
jgi:hypothetical protein